MRRDSGRAQVQAAREAGENAPRTPGPTVRRVCIEARVPEGIAGGTQQFVIGLASGLSRLDDSSGEEYLFIADPGTRDWLEPHLGGACRVLEAPRPSRAWSPPRWAQQVERLFRGPLRVWRNLPFLSLVGLPRPLHSDGLVEGSGAALVHFPTQRAYLTAVPSIYHPHDLQHIHLPGLFTRRERAAREVNYRTFCREAVLVPVSSTWVKNDLIRHYGLTAEKVAVIPLAPATEAYPTPTDRDVAACRRRLSLPERFLFFPAQTYPHKNHLALLAALARLRAEGLDLPLVCAGYVGPFYSEIQARAIGLGVADLVQFTGFISPEDLQCLYALARAVVIPSKFEAASFPIWEAQLAGVPVACSAVTSLPLQGGDAVLLFHPDRPEEIAAQVRRLWVDEGLRQELVLCGRARVAEFTWLRTAALFRAHYRRLAGWPVTEADAALLAAPVRM